MTVCIAKFPTEFKSLTGNYDPNINTLALTRLQIVVSDENEIIPTMLVSEVLQVNIAQRGWKLD